MVDNMNNTALTALNAYKTLLNNAANNVANIIPLATALLKLPRMTPSFQESRR
jgi:hypothetical protein